MEPGAPRHDVEGEHPQTSCYRVSRRPVVGQAGKQGYFIKIQSSRSSVFVASVADSFFFGGRAVRAAPSKNRGQVPCQHNVSLICL
jgi:hypothetical protein